MADLNSALFGSSRIIGAIRMGFAFVRSNRKWNSALGDIQQQQSARSHVMPDIHAVALQGPFAGKRIARPNGSGVENHNCDVTAFRDFGIDFGRL